MKKNLLKVVVLTIILSLCLSSGVFAAETTELTMQMGSWWSERAPLIVEEFEKAYPQYKLKIDCLPVSGYFENAVTAILAGTPPDILSLGGPWIVPFAAKNLLTDLTADVAEKVNKADFKSAAWDMAFYEGKMYGFPLRVAGGAMFYNKTMFDDAGVAYPEKGWTFDDLLDMAKKITVPGEKYGYGISVDMSDQSSVMLSFAPVLWGFGGDFFNADNTKCTLDSPEAIKALTWQVELYTKHKVVPEGTMGYQITRDVLPLFANNKVAIVPGGEDKVDFFNKYPDLKWDLVEMPNGGWNKAAGWSFTIPVTAKHKKEALDLLLWWAIPEVQAQLNIERPSNMKAWEMAEPWNTPLHKEWGQASLNGKALPTIGEWAEALVIFIQELQKTLLEEKTPEQAAKDMTAQIDKLLE